MPAPLPGNHNNNYGFTLIELSIVLVIIGLIVGGVLVGRDLIKAAAIRAQISQVEKYQTAVNTFKTKYGYMPGDILPAQASQLGFFTFTGTYAGMRYPNSACAYGNNNGFISVNETYVFWQHLSEAGLVEGKFGGSAGGDHLDNNAIGPPLQYYFGLYSCKGGIPVDSTQTPIAGLTPTKAQKDIFMPKAKLNDYANISALANDAETRNAFRLGGSARESFSIDSKIDDGIPYSGSVRIDSPMTVLNCTKGSFTNPTYDLTPATADNAGTCSLSFFW